MEWVSDVAQNTMSGHGFSCACNVGYSNDNLYDTVCSDVDECLNDADNMCNLNADCRNTTVSEEYTCKALYWEREGMDGDNGSAGYTDVDECATVTYNCVSCYGAVQNDVSPGAPECVNHNEGFTCNCPAGFWAKEGKICLDIDECDPNDRKCDGNADCSNYVGSQSCSCHAGWDTTDGGATSFDVDECAFTGDDAVCDNATCNYIDGSFECT